MLVGELGAGEVGHLARAAGEDARSASSAATIRRAGGEVDAERLLAQEVLAGRDRVEVELLVQVVRDGEVEDVEVGVLEQRAAVVGQQAHACRCARTTRSASGLVSQTASSRGVTGWSVERRPAPDRRRQLAAHQAAADDPDAGDAHAQAWPSACSGVAPSCTTAISARGHRRGVVVLDHVAAVDDPGRALLEHGVRALEDLLVGDAAAAAHEQRHARDGDDAVVVGEVVGGVGLDDVGAELDRLADEAADAVDVAARRRSRPRPRLERERLDHQRHRRRGRTRRAGG